MRFQSFQRRFYLVLQIFSGGLALFTLTSNAGSDRNAATLVLLVALSLVGGVGVWLGVAGLEGKSNSYRWCMFWWALQIPNLSLSTVTYRVFNGAEFRIAFDVHDLGLMWDMHLGNGFVVQHSIFGQAAYIGINVFGVGGALHFYRTWTSTRGYVNGLPRT